MKRIKNILYLSAGSHGSPGVLQELRDFRDFKIVGVDIKDISHAQYLFDKYYQVPKYDDPNYVKVISEIFRNELIDICVFGSTREMIQLQENGIPCLMSNPDTLKITVDKFKTYSMFPEYAPDFIPICKGDDIYESAKKLGYPEKELCFKPQIGSGGRGFRVIAGKDYDKTNDVFFSKDTSKITLEELDTLEFPPLLLMEKLEGKNYHVDILANKGKIVKLVISYRIEEIMGLGYCLNTTTEKSEYVEIANNIVSKLQLNYNCFFQMMGDKLLEVGGRAAGSVPIGQDMIGGAIKLYEGGSPNTEVDQLTFLRYWKPLFILR